MLFVPPSMPYMVPEAEAQDNSTDSGSTSTGSGSNSTGSGSNNDTTLPVVLVPVDISVSALSTSGKTVSFIFNATDNIGITSGPTCSSASGSIFSVGTTTVTCTATDAAGNVGTGSFTVTVTLEGAADTTLPVVTVPADINLSTTNSQGWVHNLDYSNDSTGPTASDNVGVTSFSCNFPSGNLYPIGTTTVTCTASDAAGNQTTESFNVTVNYMATDNIAPVFSSIYWSDRSSPDDRYYFTEVNSWPYSSNPIPLNDVVVAEDSSGYDYTFRIGAHDGFYHWFYSLARYDNQGLAFPGISCSGLSGLQSSGGGWSGTYHAIGVVFSGTFPIGTTTITCAATDVTGNTATESFTVTVAAPADTTPPVITVPSDQTFTTTDPAGYVYNFQVSATDDVEFDTTGTGNAGPGIWCVDYVPHPTPPGTLFPVGTTHVVCSGIDTTGNYGQSVFTVTVVLEGAADTPAPTVTATAYLNGTSPTGRTLSIDGDNWGWLFGSSLPTNYLTITLYKDGNPLSGSDKLYHVGTRTCDKIPFPFPSSLGNQPCLILWPAYPPLNPNTFQIPIPESWSAGTYTAHWNMIGSRISSNPYLHSGYYDGEDISFTVPALSDTAAEAAAAVAAADAAWVEANPGMVKNAVGSSTPGCEDTNSCFIPSTIAISTGDTVTWVNTDNAAHTVTSGEPAPGDGPSDVFDSSLMMAGSVSFSHTFDAAGTYPYFCMVHPWMLGTVIVTGAAVEEEIIIPSWIKSNAGWWDAGLIDDRNYVTGLQWLITNGIMTIPSTEQGTGSDDVIPSWVKNNARWWADGSIDDRNYVTGLQWLITNGVMTIG